MSIICNDSIAKIKLKMQLKSDIKRIIVKKLSQKCRYISSSLCTIKNVNLINKKINKYSFFVCVSTKIIAKLVKNCGTFFLKKVFYFYGRTVSASHFFSHFIGKQRPALALFICRVFAIFSMF